MAAIPILLIAHPGGYAPNPVMKMGDGRPVVYLHGLYGQEWPPLLDELARSNTVYAPATAGTSDPLDLAHMTALPDLILYYDDLFDALGLDHFILIGHSFGGMVAAEYAAAYPAKVEKLVLIDALGLWSDDYPVADHLLISDAERIELLYHDRNNSAVVERLRIPEDRVVARDGYIRTMESIASSAHFIHPIPERGLRRRLRRIRARTLIVWGREDRLTAMAYAGEFAAGIGQAEVCIIPNAGHVPHLEQSEAVSSAVHAFLALTPTAGGCDHEAGS
jgi:pimeloyl-ACP methyl ester carboxylesterase